MMLLAATPVANFQHLAQDAGLTAGNLAAHLRALEGVGYAESFRGLVDLKPRVRYRITDAGRTALDAYLATLETFLTTARAALASGRTNAPREGA